MPLEEVEQRALQRPCVVGGREPRLAADVQAVEHLAPHVELELLGRRVADAHGRRALVPGQPVDGELGDTTAAVDAVHDLQVGRVAGDRTQQPLAPRARLGHVAGAEQRLQRERGVAQPAEAVVPVAGAAELLGQRRGRRRGDASAGCVRQGLERHERASYRVLPASAVARPRYPVGPEALRLALGAVGVLGARAGPVGRVVREDERDPLARRHLEPGPDGALLVHHLDRGVELQRVGAGDRRDVGAVDRGPRRDRPVVEPRPQLGRHAHAPGHALDDAHDVGYAVAGRHEVDDADPPVGRGPLALQDEGVPAVAPGGARPAARRRQPPEPVLRPAEQRREAGGRVQPGQAQPVDRAVPADEGRGVQVPDDPVVLDALRHLMSVVRGHAPRRWDGGVSAGRTPGWCRRWRRRRSSTASSGRPTGW